MSAKSLSNAALQYTLPGWLVDQTAKVATGKRLSSAGTLGLQGAEPNPAVDAQKRLEEENRARLAREAADRAEGKRRAETTGQRAGFGASGFGGIFSGAGSSRSRARGSLFGN